MATPLKASVSEQLSHFGCTPREATIYVKCLQQGPATVQQIAGQLNFHRVTVHSAVEQLLKKGLLTETRHEKRRLILAERPDVLYRLLQQKESQLRLARSGLDSVVKYLSEFSSESKSSPSLRFYRGADGLRQMLEETLKTREEVLVFTDIEQLRSLVEEDQLRDYYERRAALGISARLLWPKTPFTKRVQPDLRRYRMTVRSISKTFDWKVGLFSWDDCLAIMSLSDESVTCTILQSSEISSFYRKVIFETLWSAGSKLGRKR